MRHGEARARYFHALLFTASVACFHALTQATASSGAPCEYWGVGLCTYDGTHRRPERCTGQGRRYCDRAPEATACPAACQLGSCARNPPARFQFHPNHFSFDWEDLVLGGHYDMVFTQADKVCVQTCWKDPWKMKCAASRMYNGRHYCVDINCEHDESNRFAGCHHDDAWHAPTCSECARLFPTACGPLLQGYANKVTPDWEYLEIQNWENPSERMEAQEAEAAAKRAKWLADLSADSSREDEEARDSSDARKESAADQSEESSEERSDESSDQVSSDDGKAKGDDDSSEDKRKSSDDDEGSKRRKSSQDSSDATDSDDGACDDSWMNYWKNLLRSSRSVDCVSANSHLQNDSRVLNYTRIPAVEAVNLPEVTSFNEITFQIAGDATSVETSRIAEVFSDLTGAPSDFVQVVDVRESLPYMASFNTSNNTSGLDGESITTVTIVIWSDDPYAVDAILLQQLDSMTEIMHGEAMMSGYLEASMSVNVVVAPDVGLQQSINLKAIPLYDNSRAGAENEDVVENNEILRIVVVTCCGVVASVVVVMLVTWIKYKRRVSRDGAGQGANDLQLVTAADSESPNKAAV